jgi:hypothetical protein
VAAVGRLRVEVVTVRLDYDGLPRACLVDKGVGGQGSVKCSGALILRVASPQA